MNLADAINQMNLLFESRVAGPLAIAPMTNGELGPKGTPWARLTPVIADRRQMYCGVTNRFRNDGYLTVQLFFPPDGGVQDLMNTLSATQLAYSSHKTNGILWKTPTTPFQEDNVDWVQWNVVCPFQFEETT